MWGRCKRYVKETRWGVKWNLGGGVSGASGQAGGEVSPSQRLADKTLLYLDIVQHYYCTQAVEAEKQARKARDEKERTTSTARQIEMQKKRDEVFGTLTNLAIKMKEPQKALTFLREQGEKLLGYGKGITEKDVINRLEILQSAYGNARPSLMVEKGIDTGGGDITTQGGPVVGTAETVTYNIYNYTIKQEPGIEEKRKKAVKEILSTRPQSSRVLTEEHQGKMESLQTELNQERLEKAKILTERSKERQDAGKYTEAKEDLKKALEILEGLECKKNSKSE